MYELTFLLNEESELKSIKSLLESLEGKIVNERSWGELPLAYSIKKQHQAKYFTWKIDIATNKILEFKRKLNFNEKLLRYLLLKVDEK
jgi:ribosomal protein S6